jgi:hypothetical protein
MMNGGSIGGPPSTPGEDRRPLHVLDARSVKVEDQLLMSSGELFSRTRYLSLASLAMASTRSRLWGPC